MESGRALPRPERLALVSNEASATKPPFWRDVKTLAWMFQLAVLGGFVALMAVLVNNVRVSSANLGIPVGFDYLDQPSGFTIPGNDLRQTETVQRAITEGLLNTLRVAIVGIILATIIGILIGIGRLSGNWLVRNITMGYVELFRNIPPLGIVLFAYLAIVLSALPRIEESWELGSLLVVSSRGIVVPWVTGSTTAVVVLALVSGIVSFFVLRWRARVAERVGGPPDGLRWALPAALLVFVAGIIVLGTGTTTPTLDGRQVAGGMTLQPEYFALLVALVLYTASHIAEIVRGSIQAVPKGQVEASMAMALSGWQRMQRIILPQALRIALPSIGNQYLNLMKNSSLGFAISYFELTKVASTAIGNGRPAVPVYIVVMAIYLVISLTISSGVNFVNRRLAIEP